MDGEEQSDIGKGSRYGSVKKPESGEEDNLHDIPAHPDAEME